MDGMKVRNGRNGSMEWTEKLLRARVLRGCLWTERGHEEIQWQSETNTGTSGGGSNYGKTWEGAEKAVGRPDPTDCYLNAHQCRIEPTTELSLITENSTATPSDIRGIDYSG
jgi:hypothetical protein